MGIFLMRHYWVIGLALAAATPSLAAAQSTEAENDFDISATITGVSDYRFRGVSLSDKDPALQGSIDVEHKSGFYLGTWASTIKGSPADVEVDIYAGWRGDAGPIALDVGAVAYLYPSGPDLDYVDILACVSYTLGPAQVKLGAAYAPDQANIGSEDNFYVYGDASVGIPNTPVTIAAHIGHENGSLAGATGKKLDWSLGAEAVVDRFTLGLSYVDTNVDRVFDPRKLAGATLVASVKVEF